MPCTACCVGRRSFGVRRLRPSHAAAAMIIVVAERTCFILRALGEQGTERGKCAAQSYRSCRSWLLRVSSAMAATT